MFFGKKVGSKKIVLFNFRSSSVAASIVAINPKTSLPKILYTRRESYYFETAPKPEEFINRAEVALKRLINDINSRPIHEPGLPHKIEEVHILYGSPWYTPSFIDANYNRSQEFVFTKDLFDQMIKGTSQEQESDIESEVIERHVASILINGYETETPFNKKACEVRLSFYFAKLASETKNEIEKIIRTNMHTTHIFHHSHPNVIYTFLKNNFHSNKNYILLDVSGEITEITTIRNSFFKKHTTIPIGSHIFSRKLSQICNYDFNTAWAHLNLYVDKKIDKECKTNAEVVFEEIKKHYLDAVKVLFKKEEVIDIPSTIFIISDDEVKGLIKHIFETPEGYAGTLKISRKPHIVTLSKNTFKDLCLYGKDVQFDNILSLFANFVKISKS